MRVSDRRNRGKDVPGHALALIALVLAAAATTVALAARVAAAPDPGLCAMNTARGAVPARFPVSACVDGNAIYIRNDLDAPVTLKTSGSAGTPTSIRVNQTPAAVLTRRHVHNPLVLMPDDLIRMPIGDAQAAVRVTGLDSAGYYAIAQTISDFIPAGATVQVYNAISAMVVEFDTDFRQYSTCVTGASRLKKAGCRALLVRNVTFAIGRAAITAGARGIAAAVLGEVPFARWTKAQVTDVKIVATSPQRVLRQAAATSSAGALTVDAPTIEPSGYGGGFQIGPLHATLKSGHTLAAAEKAFGKPASCAGGVDPTASWPKFGLTGYFATLGAFPPGVTPNGCVSPAWVQPDHFVLRGSRWQTKLGLKVGSTVADIMRLYSNAAKHHFAYEQGVSGDGYWLTTRPTPWNGQNAVWGRLIAIVSGGKVTGFDVSLQDEGE
jgi:hypothetical protein